MKHKLLILLMIAFSAQAWSQEGPVAVDDYIHSALGQTVMVPVLENDFHPEELTFKIATADKSLSYTDSTITYWLNYDSYSQYRDTIRFNYLLVDERGLNGYNALGFVYILVDNHQYYSDLDVNNIKAHIETGGLQFASRVKPDTLSGMFEFPKGSGKNSNFSSTIWVGGLDEQDALKLSAVRYGWEGSDFWSGPLSSSGSVLSIDTSTVLKWHKVWKLSKEEVNYHILHYQDTGYEPAEEIASWPAHGDTDLNQAEYLAPFVDLDGDGVYRPMQGDYPLIRGDQCIYFIFNDLKAHKSTGGSPLGLEIHGMAYAFSKGDADPINNTIFLSYKIHNRSSHTYHNAYIAMNTDIEIGFNEDDYMGCDVSRGTFYGSNGDSYDEGVYRSNSPAQATVVLGGPLMDDDGVDNPAGQCNEGVNGIGFGDGVTDNERFGLCGFTEFDDEFIVDSFNVQGYPQVVPEYFNYMKSLWKDGSDIEYGGNGYPGSGAYGPKTKFMFPGLTDPCNWGTGGEQPNGPVDWTENSVQKEPGDRKGFGIIGPFTFEPGTMERIDVAYVASFADPGETAVETLMHSVDEVRAKYLENPTFFGYQWLGMEQNQINPQENKLLVYPNPVTNNLTFSYKEISGGANYILTDMMGKIEMTGKPDRNESHTLDVSQLNPGIYVLSVISDNGNYTTKVIKY